MSAPPFVAVVGTVNFDLVITESGETFESLGGILYNGLMLADLLDATDIRVRLVARLGEEHRETVQKLFADRPAADCSGLVTDPRGTNLSRLDFSRGPEREEDVELRVPPLDAKDLEGLESARAILVNMISGRDVERETLRALRQRSSACFLLDVQALARTLESPRRPRSIPDWREWASLFHVVRGNEAEIAAFAGGGRASEVAALAILECGPEEVFVTRGPEGSTRFTREDGALREERIDPVPRLGPIDSTGCGDAYDAALVVGRVLGFSGGDAARLGSFVGSEVAGVKGLHGVRTLRGIGQRAARFDLRFAALAPPAQ